MPKNTLGTTLLIEDFSDKWFFRLLGVGVGVGLLALEFNAKGCLMSNTKLQFERIILNF